MSYGKGSGADGRFGVNSNQGGGPVPTRSNSQQAVMVIALAVVGGIAAFGIATAQRGSHNVEGSQSPKASGAIAATKPAHPSATPTAHSTPTLPAPATETSKEGTAVSVPHDLVSTTKKPREGSHEGSEASVVQHGERSHQTHAPIVIAEDRGNETTASQPDEPKLVSPGAPNAFPSVKTVEAPKDDAEEGSKKKPLEGF